MATRGNSAERVIEGKKARKKEKSKENLVISKEEIELKAVYTR